MVDKRTVVVCGAIAGGLIGAGYILWHITKGRHSHHHRHGPDFNSEDAVDMWIDSQFGKESEFFDFSFSPKEAINYSMKVVELCRKHKKEGVLSRALDLGCSTGRITFELAAYYDEVIGIDVSEISINKANQLKKDGRISYRMIVEGEIKTEHEAIVNPDIDRSRVQFQVGDACALPSDLGQFGLIVLVNTLHHFPDPLLFLTNAKDLIVPDGIMIIVEMYYWHDMLDLPKDRWISGYTKENRDQVRGLDGLKQALQDNFELLEIVEIQQLVKWQTRAYMLVFPEATVWKRK